MKSGSAAWWIATLAAGGLGMSACGSDTSSDPASAQLDGGSGADADSPDGAVPVGTCDADVRTDPHNCGACLHDCLGGNCTDGQCQSVDLPGGIQGTETVDCFTIDDTSIYYALTTNTGAKQINKMPLGGGSTTTLASGESGCPMLQNGPLVYWLVGEKSLRSIPKAGGTPVTAMAWNEAMHTRRIVSDGSAIFWVVEKTVGSDPFGPKTATAIMTVPLSGGVPTELGTGPVGGYSSYSVLAVDADHVYWFDRTDVRKIPKVGGTPVLLATGNGPSSPGAMAVDKQFVYWVQGDYFAKVTLAGGVPTRLAKGFGASYLQIDALNGYYCDTKGVERAPLEGVPFAGPPTLLAKRSTGFDSCKAGLEIDSSAIYWSSGDAIIHRLAK